MKGNLVSIAYRRVPTRLQYGHDPRAVPGTMLLTSAKRVLKRAKSHGPLIRRPTSGRSQVTLHPPEEHAHEVLPNAIPLPYMRVWLLGGFRVSIGARTIEDEEWRRRKPASLGQLIVLAPGHRLPRKQAMDLLWPDLGRGAAPENLRRVANAARRFFASTNGSRYLASMIAPDE